MILFITIILLLLLLSHYIILQLFVPILSIDYLSVLYSVSILILGVNNNYSNIHQYINTFNYSSYNIYKLSSPGVARDLIFASTSYDYWLYESSSVMAWTKGGSKGEKWGLGPACSFLKKLYIVENKM